MFLNDPERVAVFKKMEDDLIAAWREGHKEITVTLPVIAWMQLIDEILDRQPRNMSRLLRDDMLDRMNAIIDRLDEEVAFLIVHGPASVASRFDPNRPKLAKPRSQKRDLASDSLKRTMAEKGKDRG